MPIHIEPAQAEQMLAVYDLLQRSGLPLDGLSEHHDTTLVARDGSAVVGSAALEMYGGSALLRSVAVDASLRGQGLGQQLTEAALAFAKQRGVKDVYLLTETAGEFFPRFGFQTISRAEVAPAVKQSVEFTTACPESALVMVKLI